LISYKNLQETYLNNSDLFNLNVFQLLSSLEEVIEYRSMIKLLFNNLSISLLIKFLFLSSISFFSFSTVLLFTKFFCKSSSWLIFLNH